MAEFEKAERLPLSGRLADHVASAGQGVLTPAVVDAFTRSLLDVTGCMIGAADLPASRSFRSVFLESGGRADATVVGSETKLPAASAAYVNGAIAHGLDFDEGHTQAGCHPGSVIFPAALAVGQQAGSRFSDVMLAVVLGYEAMIRLSLAIHPRSAKKGWHNTNIAGVFGAAAAAGRLYGLNAGQLANAFGIALSMAGGTFQYQDNGADTKRLHAGKAAHDGIIAAQMARAGITGPAKALEGPFGLARMFADTDIDPDIFADLGAAPPLITVTYFKPYAGNRHFHAVLDALSDLRRTHGLVPDAIRSVDLFSYSSAIRGHTHTAVESILDAQSSLPFMAALALAEGRATPRAIAAAFETGQVAALASRVAARIDDGFDALYPRQRGGRAEITLADGRVLTASVTDPKGEPGNPMSDAELDEKFRDNCASILGPESITGLIADIRRCNAWGDADALMSRLGALLPQ